MARGSVSRKVARAARTGGSRTRRAQTPLGYYLTLIIVILLGAATVAFSRYQVKHPAAAVAPTLSDHWHAALAVDICGKVQPNLPKSPNLSKVGINTQGDGLIDIAPKSKSETGHNATLGLFAKDYPGLTLTSTSLGYPGKKVWHNGDKCGTKAGHVQVETWGSLASTHGQTVADPSSLQLQNGQLITVAFVAPGTSLPKPPSRFNLLKTTTTTAPATTGSTKASSSTPTTKAPSKSTATTAKGKASTATTKAAKPAAGSSTTAKP